MISPAHPYRLGRKEYSLGKNRNYQYVYRKGKSTPSRYIVLVYVPAHELKVGYSVSSKVGCAVVRNRIRRYLKEETRLLKSRLKEGKYIFVARGGAALASHEAIASSVRHAVKHAGLYKEGGLPDVS